MAAVALLSVVVAAPGRLSFAVLAVGTIAVVACIAAAAARVARRAPAHYKPRWYNRPLIYAALAAAAVGLRFPYQLLVNKYVAEKTRVLTNAMAPTLLAGDRVYSKPLGDTPPARGTNVSYHLWGTPYVKRVLGLPNDTLEMRGGTLLINRRALAEPYATHAGERETPDRLFAWQRRYLVRPQDRPPSPSAGAEGDYTPTLASWGPLVVPPHSYFVLGDNRAESMDSRYHGFLPDTAITGHAAVIYFSRDRNTGHIRWSRIGQAVH